MELKSLVEDFPRSYFKLLTAKHCKKYGKSLSYLNKWITESTPLLSDSCYLISTKVNWILNGRTSFPTCKMCGKTIGIGKNLQLNTSYANYCKECQYKHAAQTTKCSIEKKLALNENYYREIVAKRKSTNIENGHDPAWNNMPKNIATCLDRYGVENVRQTEGCKKKIKQTKLKNHNDENYVNADQIKKTNNDRYGVDWPMQSEQIRAKAATEYVYDAKTFDSKGELCYYIWLKDINIDFTYHPMAKLQYVYNGKTHYYFPDFIVKGQFVEIKGDHFFKEDGTMQNPYDHSQDCLL